MEEQITLILILILLSINPKVKSLGHMVAMTLISWWTSLVFPQWLHHFILINSWEVSRFLKFSTSLATLVYLLIYFGFVFNNNHRNWCKVNLSLCVCVCVCVCVLACVPRVIAYNILLVAQSCLTLSNPMDYSPPGSSVHGTFQTRILEWITISFSSRSSQARDWNIAYVTAK